MKPKPHIFKAILFSLLSLIVFGLAYILTFLIVGGIIYLLTLIPIVNKLIGWLFYIRGDTPNSMLILLSTIIAYVVTTEIHERIIKDDPTTGLSCILTGSYIALLQIASLIINIMYGDPFFINIVQIIAGISLIVHGKNTMSIESES